jgi:hypothetical protein
MNRGILVARTQEAIEQIETHTRRLGGELAIRPTRGDAAHRQLFTLEAIAGALAGIDSPVVEPGAGVVVESVTEDPAPARRKAAGGKER